MLYLSLNIEHFVGGTATYEFCFCVRSELGTIMKSSVVVVVYLLCMLLLATSTAKPWSPGNCVRTYLAESDFQPNVATALQVRLLS